ncbi:MAG: hypothetical protein HDT26_13670 [Subdoligranulum sp.]|nr:hypothetical protein [Subdoligranulum sp.]MBD5095292.1 hypothetical protein [Subdoligranulum sp.]
MRKNFSTLTAAEKRELVLQKKNIPTSIFLGGKEKKHIVQARGTIYGAPTERKPLKP